MKPIAEQIKQLADVISSNGLSPRCSLAQLSPDDFNPGEMRLAVAMLKSGARPQDDVKPLLSIDLLSEMYGANPETNSLADEYLTLSQIGDILGSTKWDWPGWLACGHLAIIAGSQEAGKSLTALHVAGCYTMGWDWPDGTPFTGKRGRVLWAEGESGQQINHDRCKAWGIDPDKIILPGLEVEDFSLGNERHRARFWEIARREDVVTSIIDSLSGIHGKRESDAEMQQVIKPLANLARDIDKSLLLSHHLNKPIQGMADVLTLNRIRGSGTITQTARIVWGLDRPDVSDLEIRRLSVLKSNFGPKPDPIGFNVLPGGLEFTDAPNVLRTVETQRGDAMDFLRDQLHNNPLLVEDVKQAAQAEEFSWSTVRKAKLDLGVVSVFKHGNWCWGLPVTR